MDLTQEVIRDVVHPTSAFAVPIPPATTSAQPFSLRESTPWDQSSVNPKNRINSLSPPINPSWRIDGCTSFGSQYYVVPIFLAPHRPLRIDLYIPELATLPNYLRTALDTDIVVHTRDARRLAYLGITRHLVRILDNWISTLVDPRIVLESVPFGSRIVLQNIPVNVQDAKIVIAPAHYLERHLLPLSALQEAWGPDLHYPPTIDISSLEFISQLHDSVCIIRLNGIDQSKKYIFKAISSYTKFLYHELHNLLTTPPHPNIVSRPLYLVTKQCTFGSKTAVAGFLLELHHHGSLRDTIPFLRLHNQTSTQIATEWAVQLSSALVHLRESTGRYYSDLRLDNIVLSGDGRLVMVDFEQRGVWCSFGAPEVNTFDYIRMLAIDGDISEHKQKHYANLLTQQLPEWEDLEEGEEYIWPSKGYNVAWECLTPIEQEACEVYMLGRVLWCIFEAHSAPQRADVWISYKWEPVVEFPEFLTTPLPMRDIIKRCTRGYVPGLNSVITRSGNKLILRKGGRDGKGASAEEVQRVATEWWTQEVDAAEKWITKRAEGMKRGDWKENFYGRPKLREVHEELVEYQKSLSPGGYSGLTQTLKRLLGGSEVLS